MGPLLTLGRAALTRGTAARGVAANTARTSTAPAALATSVGFGDIMSKAAKQSPASNVIDFKSGRSVSSGGAAAPMRTPTVSSNTSLAGDIQAASELSMEELADQTKVLKEIQKNTKVTAKNTMAPPSAGGQAAAPPSEEEIKRRLDGDKKAEASMLGKFADKLSSDLGSALLALGAAVAAVEGDKFFNKEKPTDFELMSGTGAGTDTVSITGVEKGATLAGSNAKFSNISQYRFTTDEKGNRVVGSAEQEANKEKKTQIMAMIGEGGDPADSQKLETAFREGDVKSIQEIEDKYRKEGTEGSQAYQYRAAEKSFSQADAVSVAKREGIDTPDLINADQETKDKFIAEMYAKQNELAKNYSAAIAGEGKNYERRAELTGDKLFKSSRLDKVVESQFDEEGKGSMFGRSTEEGKAFDNIKAELEGYTKSLKESGLGERATNNLIADELKKLESLSAEQMLEYTAPKVSGDKLSNAQQQADQAMDQKAASQRMPAAAASAPSQQQPAPTQDTVTTGISINNKAHDDLAKELAKRNSGGFLSSFGF